MLLLFFNIFHKHIPTLAPPCMIRDGRWFVMAKQTGCLMLKTKEELNKYVDTVSCFLELVWLFSNGSIVNKYEMYERKKFGIILLKYFYTNVRFM